MNFKTLLLFSLVFVSGVYCADNPFSKGHSHSEYLNLTNQINEIKTLEEFKVLYSYYRDAIFDGTIEENMKNQAILFELITDENPEALDFVRTFNLSYEARKLINEIDDVSNLNDYEKVMCKVQRVSYKFTIEEQSILHSVLYAKLQSLRRVQIPRWFEFFSL